MNRLHGKKCIANLLLVSLLVTQCSSYARATELSYDNSWAEEASISENRLELGEDTPMQVSGNQAFFAFRAGTGLGLDTVLSWENGAYVARVGENLQVKSAAGLIALSQVNPREYADTSIVLTIEGNETDYYDLTQSVEIDGTEYAFQGLGSDTYPFGGKISFVQGSERNFVTTTPLFWGLSTKAELPQGGITFQLSDPGEDTVETDTDSVLLAENVLDGSVAVGMEKNWKVNIQPPAGTIISSIKKIGGVLGTLSGGTVKITLTVADSLKLQCSSTTSQHMGLFCREMKENTSLIAVLGSGDFENLSVLANNGDAGGFVGNMGNGAVLTASGAIPGSIQSMSGNAGGIAGTVQQGASIQKPEEVSSFALYQTAILAGNQKGAGGIAGEYVYSGTNAPDLKDYAWSGTGNSSGLLQLGGYDGAGCYAGALFGVLESSGDFTLMPANDITVSSTLSAGVMCYGGLFGSYRTDNLDRFLRLDHLTVNSDARNKNVTAYGGVVGELPVTSYVQIEGVTASVKNGNSGAIGGLIGKAGEKGAVLLNIGSETADTVIGGAVSGSTVGGIVGSLQKGVVRLYGTTDLSGFSMSANGEKVGQLVGDNNNGLIYGKGTGNGNGTTEWLLKRNGSATASDIGNWGAVVRLDGSKLKEEVQDLDQAECASADSDVLFVWNKKRHTVTIQGAPTDTYTIDSVRDFAAYALAFDYCASDSNKNIAPVLLGGNVNCGGTQTITINTDIDLTGTGIFGIGRDKGDFYNPNQTCFMGSLQGTDDLPTVTLDIGGESFGENAGTNLKVVGASHNAMALLPVAADASISKLKIAGKITGNTQQDWNKKTMAGVVAIGAGNLTFTRLETSVTLTVAGTGQGYSASGFVGEYIGGYDNSREYKLEFSKCDFKGSVTSDMDGSLGGYVANLRNNNPTQVSAVDSAMQGRIISTSTQNLVAGGLIAQIEGNNPTDIQISNLSVNNAVIEAASATGSCGGFLGYSWLNTNVTFGQEAAFGVAITKSAWNAPNGSFGGLVYQATGYWNATAKDSIRFLSQNSEKNSIVGKTTRNNPSGLLVCKGVNGDKALYLEIGTFGTADDSAYFVSGDTLTLTLSGDSAYFDELVGTTILNSDYLGENRKNGVVSLATTNHQLVDTAGCNTYTSQLEGNYQNVYTRYYYNLDVYRKSVPSLTPNSLDSPQKVLLWSVSLQAASNISDYFCSNTNSAAKLTGIINLQGYSYYPVTAPGDVSLENAAISFGFEAMNEEEKNASNKEYSNSSKQHYLMQYGLLGNHKYNLTVENTDLSGTVGLLPDSAGLFSTGKAASGALLLGTITGDPNASPEILRTITLRNVTLSGLRVSRVEASTAYAPLLINTIGEGVSLSIEDLATGTGYTATGEGGTTTSYAASSLIGSVGSATATKLSLSFVNIALDSRTLVNGTASDSVNNNGEVPVAYHTTHSIFTRATLLDSFQYTTGSSGSYNFNSTDTKVTYGKEISNTDSGRNAGQQYCYYDKDIYVWDGFGTRPTEENINSYYSSGSYLPYVRQSEGGDNYKELDINLRVAHLLEGCGTYGDPYRITGGEQLVAVADFINNGSTNSAWGVCINETVYAGQNQTSSSYHTAGNDNQKDKKYLCEGTNWYIANESNGQYSKGQKTNAVNIAGVRTYLRNAYYRIENDIEITSSSYVGLGGADPINLAFSGVIVGINQTPGQALPDYPTITIAVNNQNVKTFGGLICYSQGSVVKDLHISYTKTDEEGAERGGSIKVCNSAALSDTNNAFFGGVIGYCIGGDTIIDNVSVTYGANSLTVSNEGSSGYDRLIATGGYVGLVGGVWNSTKKGETAGGGVIFRHMQDKTNPFVGTVIEENSKADSSFFYCNPFVGRVLDGYVCYDTGSTRPTAMSSTLDNTDKNYTIPDLYTQSDDLVVNEDMAVSANTPQGLWLLSAIVNSGAGAMSSDGSYLRDSSNKLEAYHYGKVRSSHCSYEGIGTEASDDTLKASRLADEAWWGGVGYSDTARVSYLVKGFTTNSAPYYAARVTGKRTADNKNHFVSLSLGSATNPNVDMTAYGNGFRGIGASYGYSVKIWNDSTTGTWDKMWRRNLLVSSLSGGGSSVTTLTINRKPKLYTDKDWLCLGAGFFVNFGCETNCTVSNLQLSGAVAPKHYALTMAGTNINNQSREDTWVYSSNEEKPDFCVGGFAARTFYAGFSQQAQIAFSDFYLKDLSVCGGKNIGGVIGCVEKTGNSKSISFSNWGMDGLSMETLLYKGGSLGGLIGWYYGNGILSIDATADSWQPAVRSELLMLSINVGTYAGGLLGAYDNGTVRIQNVILKNCKIEGFKTDAVGGMVGKNNNNHTISNCTLQEIEVLGTSCNYTGGVVGLVKNDLTMADCTLQDVKVLGTNSKNTGGVTGKVETKADISGVRLTGNSYVAAQADNIYSTYAVGGFLGYTSGNVTISDSDIIGEDGAPVRILNGVCADKEKNLAGGFVGHFNGQNKTLQIRDCSMAYVSVLSGTAAGGLVAYSEQQNLHISDTALTHCAIAIRNDYKANLQAGVIASGTWNNVYGYNILVESTILGYYENMTFGIKNAAETYLVGMKDMNLSNMGLYTEDNNSSYRSYDSLQAAENIDFTNTKIGRFVGSMNNEDAQDKSIQLIAVACKDSCLPPVAFGGNQENGYSKVVYADYPVTQSNTPEDSSAPYLDVNPINNTLAVKENQTSDNRRNLTGNGVAMTEKTDEKGNPVSLAKEILDASSSTLFLRQYGNLTAEITAREELCNTESPVYLTTYQKEEGDSSHVPVSVDFPLLVINTNENGTINSRIWSLVAALTNAKSLDLARESADSIRITTYRWISDSEEASTGSFVKQDNNSLNYNSETKALSINGRFDNQQEQFTLLDVEYSDPTDTTGTRKYHLYIPLLVKKLLQARVTVRMLEGTNYFSGDYPENSYATAGFEENLTAFIEFNYQNTKEDWQNSLDAFENLLWSYQKRISFAGDVSGKLPSGTRLSLFDRQTGGIYAHSLTNGDEQLAVSLETLFGSIQKPWENRPVCDLLSITATEDNEKGTYVITTKDDEAATVRVKDEQGEYIYFRPKTETAEDAALPAYYLTTKALIGTDNYLERGEGYYLTLWVPKSDTKLAVNNLMQYPENKLIPVEGTKAPPTKLIKENTRYYIYDGVEQKAFSISTNRVNGGSHPQEEDDTFMANKDSIRITLETTLGLSDNAEVKELFQYYTPKELYQQFIIQLKKYDTAGKGMDIALGAESAKCNYTIYDGADNPVFQEVTVQDSLQGKEQLLVGGKALSNEVIEKLKSTESLRICAEVELYYNDVAFQDFPQRGKDNENGIGVVAGSCVASKESTLTITKNKLSAADEKRYYIKTSSNANLNFDILQTEEGIESGDKNIQLGINSNDSKNYTTYLRALGKYEYFNVDSAVLNQAQKIRYTLTLYQKNEGGSYSDEPLVLKTYWTDLLVNDVSCIMGEQVKWEETLDFIGENEGICSLPIQFSVRTGSDFEEKGLTYSNYKVCLTAVLLDEQDTELAGTEAADYFIYTNARIMTHLLE